MPDPRKEKARILRGNRAKFRQKGKTVAGRVIEADGASQKQQGIIREFYWLLIGGVYWLLESRIVNAKKEKKIRGRRD
jgi:hypothetical protein